MQYLFILSTECINEFHMILRIPAIISLNSINQLVFVKEAHCVFFAVRAEFLNTM
jgi:hypothetical protein